MATHRPRPIHLGEAYASQWEAPCMAEDYPNRPPYSGEVYDLLAGLLPAGSRRVLDIGCGTGDVARLLAPRYVDRRVRLTIHDLVRWGEVPRACAGPR